MSLRDTILNAKDLKEETFFVPEWDAMVKVRGLTGRKRSELMESCMVGQGRTDLVKFYPEIVIASVFDPETDKPIFQPEDRDLLNEKSGRALERVAQVAVRLSGLDFKALENAEKNLPETQKGGSILS